MTPLKSSILSNIDINSSTLDDVDTNKVDTKSVELHNSETVKVEFSEEIITKEPEVICKCCGRSLKEANSRILGMGPTCYKRFIAERNKQINLLCHKSLGKTQDDG